MDKEKEALLQELEKHINPTIISRALLAHVVHLNRHKQIVVHYSEIDSTTYNAIAQAVAQLGTHKHKPHGFDERIFSPLK